MRKSLILVALLALDAAAQAQLPGLRKRGPQEQQQPVLQGIDALRADFAAQSGGTTVYFGAENVGLTVPARTVLSAQANWLRRHPEVVVRIGFWSCPTIGQTCTSANPVRHCVCSRTDGEGQNPTWICQ